MYSTCQRPLTVAIFFNLKSLCLLECKSPKKILYLHLSWKNTCSYSQTEDPAFALSHLSTITSGLLLGRAEVLQGLRNFLNMDRPQHHSTDCIKERGVEKGSGRHSTLQGWEWSVFNHANIGTVLRATLGRLLRDGPERVWAFPSATMPSQAETETITDTVLIQFGVLLFIVSFVDSSLMVCDKCLWWVFCWYMTVTGTA